MMEMVHIDTAKPTFFKVNRAYGNVPMYTFQTNIQQLAPSPEAPETRTWIAIPGESATLDIPLNDVIDNLRALGFDFVDLGPAYEPA